ncbi:MAG: hypothetical protein O3A55_00525 [Bacteroidetes bacterium]|nr:hypothetical protein [Bacteroidota bacterium]
MKLFYFILFFIFTSSLFSQSWQITKLDSSIIKYEKNIIIQRDHLVFSIQAKKDTQNVNLKDVKEITRLGSFSKGFFWGLFLGGLAGGGATYTLIQKGDNADKIITLAGGTAPLNNIERDRLVEDKEKMMKYTLIGAGVIGIPLGIVAGLITSGSTKYDLSKLSIEHKKDIVTKILKD